MKKEIILSALLLSQPLTPFTARAVGPALNADAAAAENPELRNLNLFSMKSIHFNSEQYIVKADLSFVSDETKERNNGENAQFELLGNITLVAKKNSRKNIQLGAGFDTDGNMMFQIIAEDEKKIKYRGFSCSSSYTGCTAEENGGDIILEFDKVTEQYSLSADIYRNLEAYDGHKNFTISNNPLHIKNIQLITQ